MERYRTRGTCSREIEFEITEDGIVKSVRFIGGCPGNTQAVAKLAEGRKAEEVVSLLKGVQCRNGTSCPDQLAAAIENYIKN